MREEECRGGEAGRDEEKVKDGNALYPGDDFVSCERCLSSTLAVTLYIVLSSCFRQYQDFLEDLEEDEALRKNVNIFRGE